MTTATMQAPVLYVFTISHYCEKARWALDACGLDYTLRHTMIGTHRRVAKKLGARRGSLPFLHTAQGVVCGSAAILDWCEQQVGTAATPWAQGDDHEARAVEKRLDDVAGVHVRRFYYSDALLNAPNTVRPIFSNGLPLWQRGLVTLGWGRIVQLMCQAMDLGEAQGRESRAVLEAELDWLDGLLSDGRPYLCGNAWSRADLAAASLLAPLVEPPEHPLAGQLQFPAQVRAAMAAWQARPVLQHVRRMYAQHRRQPA
ncbi:glutathione S-transferase N-terminal domain-containing protein [Curvibacter sp. APW13]|uniref:glutathione S-transferase family protein n=1 Tax=Curvibacter sp. APW13 TaxID=3077236 RepID=UPI0028DDBDB4|nr:glutathione S-transferase N-terminal domain-containing protein [Curvibacter sp. APW13]MDT8990430.1 glutathione S-transferase N-terminal domain-containing protein [Curvibacter sp. APW13]